MNRSIRLTVPQTRNLLTPRFAERNRIRKGISIKVRNPQRIAGLGTRIIALTAAGGGAKPPPTTVSFHSGLFNRITFDDQFAAQDHFADFRDLVDHFLRKDVAVIFKHDVDRSGR